MKESAYHFGKSEFFAIIDKKEDSDVKVGNATISQPNKPSATVTVNGELGASTLVATNVKTYINK